jgi:hypothetical protein
MSLSVIGVLCATLALTLMWKRKKTRRTQSVLMFIVGLVISGGAVGHTRDRIAHLASSHAASATAKAFGVGVPYAVFFFLALWWFLDMDLDGLVASIRKRTSGKGGATTGRGAAGAVAVAGSPIRTNKHQCTWFTPWLGLLVPLCLAALPIVGGLPEVARHGITTLAAMVG